jgi:hypothetical protein
MKEGIVVGSDEVQEWLLPWWWKYYSLHNDYPVAFVDFGMSKKAKAWCRQKGTLIPFSKRSFPKATPNLAKEIGVWRTTNYPKWRRMTLQKPFAMMLSPFDTSIWIDLDCEICESLSPLFKNFPKKKHFAAATDRHDKYNSGLILFRKNSPILAKWALHCKSAPFKGDDFALNDLAEKEPLDIELIPRAWNWLMTNGFHPLAKVCHWASEGGKNFIKYHEGIQNFRP